MGESPPEAPRSDEACRRRPPHCPGVGVGEFKERERETHRIKFWHRGKKGCATYGRKGLEIERKYEQKIELNSGIWGKGVCDVWEKGAGEREKKMKRKSNYILAYGEKGVCDVWEKGVGEREKDEKKTN